MSEALPYRTEPVSFTRRGGRLNERQQSAWDELAERYVLDVPRIGPSTSVDPAHELDVEATFGRQAPLVVEIGSGRGEAVVAAAQERPDHDFLALEVYKPGVAQTLVQVRQHRLTNVRLAIVNAAEALATMVPAERADEVWVFFPDPWHKKRHHKRRLVDDSFLPLVRRVLRPGGTLRLATDWLDYAEQMDEVLARAEGFDHAGRTERFAGRTVTRFETKGTTVGRDIWDLTATRR